MAKAPKKKATKPAKKRANNYDEKLKINGTFDEVMKALITPKQPKKENE
jgi:hypothetical protein